MCTLAPPTTDVMIHVSRGILVKKKIIAMVLLGFIMVGSLVQLFTKPVQADHPIVLEFDEPDPGKKIGG